MKPLFQYDVRREGGLYRFDFLSQPWLLVLPSFFPFRLFPGATSFFSNPYSHLGRFR